MSQDSVFHRHSSSGELLFHRQFRRELADAACLFLFRLHSSNRLPQIFALFATFGAQTLQLFQVNLRLLDVARQQMGFADVFVRALVIGVEHERGFIGSARKT